MLGLLQEGEDISLGHFHLEVPSGYPQDKHLSDKHKCYDEQGALGPKRIE